MGDLSKRFLVSPACYTALYPSLVEVARSLGYALAIHGSMTRDFDLVAIPWTEDAVEDIELAKALKNQLSAVFVATHYDKYAPDGNPNNRLHGRRSWSIHLTDSGCDGPYIDLSIMPRSRPAADVPGAVGLPETDPLHSGRAG